jgi:hypothetical protein
MNLPVPVAARSKAQILAAWLVGSRVRIRLGHGCWSLCLYVVLICVGRGLCDRLIRRPKESYPMANKIQKPPPKKASENVDRLCMKELNEPTDLESLLHQLSNS